MNLRWPQVRASLGRESQPTEWDSGAHTSPLDASSRPPSHDTAENQPPARCGEPAGRCLGFSADWQEAFHPYVMLPCQADLELNPIGWDGALLGWPRDPGQERQVAPVL